MKYPRTPHLPWSPGGTSDDRRLLDVSSLVGRPLIVTEKADGSNTCLEIDPEFKSFGAMRAAG